MKNEAKKINLELLACKEMHDRLNQQYEAFKEQKAATDEQKEETEWTNKERKKSLLWFIFGTGVFVLATFLFLELIVQWFSLPVSAHLRTQIEQNTLMPIPIDNQALLLIPYIWIVAGYLYIIWVLIRSKSQQTFSSNELTKMESRLKAYQAIMKNTLEKIGIRSVTTYNLLHEQHVDLEKKMEQCISKIGSKK